MNEAAAREVLLVQAFERAAPESPNWTEADRAWASRLALASTGTRAAPEAYITERAHHALQRLAVREPALVRWRERRLWRWQWVAWAMFVTFVIGLAADSIGGGQRINLLAPPMWAVIVWNLAVYLLLIGHAVVALRHRGRRPRRRIVLLMQRLLAWGRDRPGLAPARLWSGAARRKAAGHAAAVSRAYAASWIGNSAPLSSARATLVLHAGSAALALGLIAGMYLRGLVLDYRAAWESTFLDAATAHAALDVLLAPAAALSGIALPDAAAFAALRVAHGSGAVGAPAAPWIHLFALTLLLWVIVPRAVLAGWSAWRAHRLARRFPLALDSPYFQGLTRQLRGETARVHVLPYAQLPGAKTEAGLRALLVDAFGEALQLQIAPVVPFGGEDEPPATPAADTTLIVALFDLAATPELEHQGRFAQQLAAASAAGVVMLVDEAAFRERFGAASERLVQRRAAWRQLAEAIDTVPVLVDLEAPDLDAAGRALQAALAAGVPAVSPE